MIDNLWQANPMSRLVPLSPGEVSTAFTQLWLDALKHPDRGMAAYADLATQFTQVWTAATLQAWGVSPPASGGTAWT